MGGKGDLYTPDARLALLATPCRFTGNALSPCSQAQADPVYRIATETRILEDLDQRDIMADGSTELGYLAKLRVHGWWNGEIRAY
jgi:hypothetical protein